LQSAQDVPGREAVWRFCAAQANCFVNQWVNRVKWVLAPDENRRFVQNVFVRCVGVVYLCAFASLLVQVRGLAGAHGILPIGSFLEAARGQLSGFERLHQIPTLCWITSADWLLVAQCVAGTLLALMAMGGVLPGVSLLALWILWLSLTVACRDFLGFQWENLLLESGLLAIFLSPWTRSLNRADPPPRIIVWLFWWLLFRLMFLSGMVKLLSGDPAWRDFTALSYHYETQPLPTVFGWFAHQSPAWVHVSETAVMYFIELAVPFVLFAGRTARLVAAALFVLLQLGIALTGNYCYFNLLTAVLCVPLLDDRIFGRAPLKVIAQPPRAVQASVGIFAILILLISSVQTATALQLLGPNEPGVGALVRYLEPLRSVNNYGLFAVMTKTRPEIIVDGSNDGTHWLPYEFRYKPGDLKQRLKFVAPHQPRLDWQMWFAALSDYRQNPWFVNFCVRLLQGEPTVLGLLAKNPFPERPPKYIRATVYNYTFTDWQTLRKTGDWWKREYVGPYFGPISLKKEEINP
jgi:hypothetical protein